MIVTVTGTGTDVGKTIATAALGVAFEQAGFEVVVAKPLQTGVLTPRPRASRGDADVDTVERLTGIQGQTMRCYPDPLAPNLAARRAGLSVPTADEVVAWIRALDSRGADQLPADQFLANQRLPNRRIVLVEGAGGLLVRMGEDYTIAEVAAKLSSPLFVVTSLGLGSLNAAELTVRAAQDRGLDVVGLIGGAMSTAPDLATRLNVEELPRVTGVPLLGVLPEGMGALTREDFRRNVPFGPDLCALIM